MVTYFATKMITCSPMIGHFFTMIVESTDRVVKMTHQNLSLGKCCKLLLAISKTIKFLELKKKHLVKTK